MENGKEVAILEIQHTLVSLDLLEKPFCCNLQACKGVCCVSGASGAPLEEEEKTAINKDLDKILPYLPDKNRKVIEKAGISMIDEDGDLVTTLVDNRECTFSYCEKRITFCAIEKAYKEGAIGFNKPVSCHLFPVRTTQYPDFEAVNYEKVDICRSAVKCGVKNEIPVYQFLKEPLIRKFGKKWYEELAEYDRQSLKISYFESFQGGVKF